MTDSIAFSWQKCCVIWLELILINHEITYVGILSASYQLVPRDYHRPLLGCVIKLFTQGASTITATIETKFSFKIECSFSNVATILIIIAQQINAPFLVGNILYLSSRICTRWLSNVSNQRQLNYFFNSLPRVTPSNLGITRPFFEFP